MNPHHRDRRAFADPEDTSLAAAQDRADWQDELADRRHDELRDRQAEAHAAAHAGPHQKRCSVIEVACYRAEWRDEHGHPWYWGRESRDRRKALQDIRRWRKEGKRGRFWITVEINRTEVIHDDSPNAEAIHGEKGATP